MSVVSAQTAVGTVLCRERGCAEDAGRYGLCPRHVREWIARTDVQAMGWQLAVRTTREQGISFHITDPQILRRAAQLVAVQPTTRGAA